MTEVFGVELEGVYLHTEVVHQDWNYTRIAYMDELCEISRSEQKKVYYG
jgi:hypothetical protein